MTGDSALILRYVVISLILIGVIVATIGARLTLKAESLSLPEIGLVISGGIVLFTGLVIISLAVTALLKWV